MKVYYYIAVVVCGLLLGCKKQQVQTTDELQAAVESSQPSQPAEKTEVQEKPLTVKGFYIGMPKEKVLAMLDSYGLTNRTETIGKLGNYYPVKKTVVHCKGGPKYHNYANFYYGSHQELLYIMMDWGMVDFLFNAARGNGRGVAHLISQSCNLPDMERIDQGMGSVLYYYNDDSVEIGVFGTAAADINPYSKILYLSDSQFAYSKWGVIFN